MYSQASQSVKESARSVANGLDDRSNKSLKDGRPETAVQTKLQSLATSAPHVVQLMKIGADIPLIPLSDAVAIKWWVNEGSKYFEYDPWYSKVWRFAYDQAEALLREGKDHESQDAAKELIYQRFIAAPLYKEIQQIVITLETDKVAKDVMRGFKLSATGHEIATAALFPKLTAGQRGLMAVMEEAQQEQYLAGIIERKLDGMTKERAREYLEAAKDKFPTRTYVYLWKLKGLYIYQPDEDPKKHEDLDAVGDDEQRSLMDKTVEPMKMTQEQLDHVMTRTLETGFANCDMQAMLTAWKMYYKIGLTDVQIISNKKLSHNYVVIPSNSMFPDGAVIDTWKGHGLRKWTPQLLAQYKHTPENIASQVNMNEWIRRVRFEDQF